MTFRIRDRRIGSFQYLNDVLPRKLGLARDVLWKFARS